MLEAVEIAVAGADRHVSRRGWRLGDADAAWSHPHARRRSAGRRRRRANAARSVAATSCAARTASACVTAGRRPGWALVIDPGLVWSTYVGGSGFDRVNSLALDAQGAVLVAGVTRSRTSRPRRRLRYDPGTASTMLRDQAVHRELEPRLLDVPRRRGFVMAPRRWQSTGKDSASSRGGPTLRTSRPRPAPSTPQTTATGMPSSPNCRRRARASSTRRSSAEGVGMAPRRWQSTGRARPSLAAKPAPGTSRPRPVPSTRSSTAMTAS
jgi:hypothetical protein